MPERATLKQLLDLVSSRAGIDLSDVDFSAVADIEFEGYSWVQGTGRQILEPMLDLLDVDIRPHDFGLQAVVRGADSAGAITTGEMVRDDEGGPPYSLKDAADGDLPRRIFLVYADATTDQNPNVAMPPGVDAANAGTVREQSIDMQTVALEPDEAQRYAERWLRRERVGRLEGEFSVTRKRLGLEPGDVLTPIFDDRAWTMRCTKLVIGANGVLSSEWERDSGGLNLVSSSAGGVSDGYVPDAVPDDIPTIGNVIDTALVADAHDQSAPLAYLVAGPEEPGTWLGADFAQSETGELDSYAVAWDGIGASFGSVMGQCSDALPDALPWVPDMASGIEVTINAGSLTAATLEELLLDPLLNLAAIRSGTGWELVQFMTPTLTGERTYQITGFLRGMRGTEWAMAGHQADDEFVLMEDAKIHTMGAGEIGDEDWYVASLTGQEPDETDAFSVLFTGASHRPYAPVHGETEFSGNDLLTNATRRTRIGGASLNNQDVPLGETAESWSLDIIDNTVSPPVVKRTINSSGLPITYTEAQQIEDWGMALNAISPILIPERNLYQVSPPLTLRGYPLNFPEINL